MTFAASSLIAPCFLEQQHRCQIEGFDTNPLVPGIHTTLISERQEFDPYSSSTTRPGPSFSYSHRLHQGDGANDLLVNTTYIFGVLVHFPKSYLK